MEFLEFFSLKEDPFKLLPDPDFFYPSSCHHEGLLLMDYSVDQKEGFLLMIGEPGTGKTTLLRVFLERWKTKAETAIILTPRLTPEEFLISVAEDLNISTDNKNKHEIIKALRDFITEKSSQGKRVIIIVDEAQNLPSETLEELRLLSNLETDKEKLLQIILLGQPELEAKLMKDELRQLNQRIASRIYLKRLNRDETLDYINHRIIRAGRENLKIHKKAVSLIYRLTKGVPRLINMLISRSLMAAFIEESSIIQSRHVDYARKSLNHKELIMQKRSRLLPVAAVLILSVMSGVLMYELTHREDNTFFKSLIEQQATPQEISTGISTLHVDNGLPGNSTEQEAVLYPLKVKAETTKLVSLDVDAFIIRQ